MSKKHIYVNLKRFDIPKAMGGVNSMAEVKDWAAHIVSHVKEGLSSYQKEDHAFTMFFPEAHVIQAVEALGAEPSLAVGCQGVYRDDVLAGGNFGAFTTNRTAKAMKSMGVMSTIIGHCEERNDKKGILKEAGIEDSGAINRILNREVKAATAAGMDILYCIGETSEETDRWKEVLREQLEIGLSDVDTKNVVIAYEPVWAIGPGKVPPERDYIEKVSTYIKEISGNLPVVYGGGLKAANAEMLASIPSIDGGLIALTRFTGDIGFYPEEYLEIIEIYTGNKKG